MTVRKYIRKHSKKQSLHKIGTHLVRHGYDEHYVSKELHRHDNLRRFLNAAIISLLVIMLIIVVRYKPEVIGCHGCMRQVTTPELNLSIWSNADNYTFSSENVYVGDTAYFFANLTNFSNHFVDNANCTIEFSSGIYNMSNHTSYNLYNFSIVLNTVGNHSYNISCISTTYGDISINNTIEIQPIPQCSNNINFSLFTNPPICGESIRVNLIDEIDIGGFDCAIYNSIFGDDGCWNDGDYRNATLNLPENISSIGASYANISNATRTYYWDLECNSTGNYTVSAILSNGSHKCKDDVSINATSWATYPNISLSFPVIPNMTVNSSYTFNLTINNTGTDNATLIEFNLSSSQISIVNLSRTVIIPKIENGTSTNYTITFTPSDGGDINFSTNMVIYKRSNGDLMPKADGATTNTFHINYNPSIIQIPNITILWNTHNDTINLSDYHSDNDIYDTDETVTWNFTGNINVTINITGNKIINFTPFANFTGANNITLFANDTWNMSVNVSFVVFVENGSNDTTCDGVDEDGDTLKDEDYVGSSCCAYSSCSTNGNTICVNGAIVCSGSTSQDTSNSIDTGGSSSGGSIFTSLEDNPEETAVTIVEHPVDPPKAEQERLSPPTAAEFDFIEKILDNNLRHTRTFEYIPGTGRTRITETIRNTGLFYEKNVTIIIALPKQIVSTADSIISNRQFQIIENDPVILYKLGILEPGQTEEIIYSVPKRLTNNEINMINVTLSKYSKTEKEKQAEQDYLQGRLERTKEAVNITTTHEMDYENNITTFKINLSLQEDVTRLENVSILMEIPKCMIEILKEEDFTEKFDVEIMQEDPLIVWHIGTIIEEQEIRISLKAIADENCTNKAQVLAIARNIVFLEKEINIQNIWIVAIISFLIFFIIIFAAGFSKIVEHDKKQTFILVKRAMNLYKIGWTKQMIKEKLQKENFDEREIDEALSLNARDRLHYWLLRFGLTTEEIIIAAIILLSFVDFFELLSAEADFIKKVVSWSLLFIIFYHVSITRILFGFKKHAKRLWQNILNLDFFILIGFMLMLSKDLFRFAQVAAEPGKLTFDFLNLMVRLQPVWEPRLFNAGLIIITLCAFYIGFVKETYNSVSSIFSMKGYPKNNFQRFIRSVMSLLLLLAFYFIVFDKIMEWLAISIDSHIVVVLMLASVYFFLKHRHKLANIFRFERVREKAAQTFAHIDQFYDHFIDLFHYRKTIILGFLGMLILNMTVGIGIFYIPYIIAKFDPLYSVFGEAGRLPLMLGAQNLIHESLAGIPFDFPLVASVVFTYLMNALAILFILGSVFYFWYWCVKNRYRPMFAIDDLVAQDFMNLIPLAITSITIFILNPCFKFLPYYAVGELGVDILSNVINVEFAYQAILIALAVFTLALILFRLFRRAIVKIYLSFSVLCLTAYMALFSTSIWSYLNYKAARLSLLQFSLVSSYSILFYVIGTCVSLVFSIMVIFSISTKTIDKLLHLNLHTLHHSHVHHNLLHGDRIERIAETVINNTAEGHELFFIAEYLMHNGYTPKEVEKAVKQAIADPRFEEAERKVKHEIHDKKVVKQLRKWLKEQLKKYNFHAVLQACIAKGYSEDDVIRAVKHLKLDKKYKELKRYGYIEGIDEESVEDEDQFEEEESHELADLYVKEGIGIKDAIKLLKDAGYDKTKISRIVTKMREMAA